MTRRAPSWIGVGLGISLFILVSLAKAGVFG